MSVLLSAPMQESPPARMNVAKQLPHARAPFSKISVRSALQSTRGNTCISAAADDGEKEGDSAVVTGQVTDAGPGSHGLSHLSNETESGQGNCVSKIPPTFVRDTLKPCSETWQSASEPNAPSNGEVEPDTPTADSCKCFVVDELAQTTPTCAVTVVPMAGASTWNSAWSELPTLPPASSSETTAPSGEQPSDTLYTKRHRFKT